MWPKTLVFFALFIVQVSCQYKNSLTFVIDDTGSMGQELAEVKKAAKSIVDIVLNEKASQIEDIVLVTFNDPGVKFWNRTRDADVFKHALDQVYIHNGYCSEKSLTGIKLALEESLPGSYLFVFTDAGSNDLHLLEKVISLCQEKQSQIVFVITDDICQTNAEYYKIARASNGQVFRIYKKQIGQVIEYVKESIKGDWSVITNQVAPLRQLTNVRFYIDDKTEYAIVSATGDKVSLKIKDKLNRDLVSGYSRIMWTENVKVLKLVNLTTGAYVAQVHGSTDVNVMVFARTDFTFAYGFSNKQEHSLSTTETQPTIGTPTHLMIFVRDEKNSVTVQTVQILDMNENVIANLSLTNMGGKVYATAQFVPPVHTFKVAVTAIGRSTRHRLRRIAKTPVAPIRPVTVSPEIIDSEPYLRKIEGSTVDLPCRIRKGKPKPRITWFFMKKGMRDYVQMRDKTDDVLYLTNVHMDNEGHYKCVAENTVGRAEHIVQLEVEVAPKIADSETYIKKREGSTVDIRCRIQKGNPTPNIRWFFMKKGTRDYVQIRDTTNEVLRLTNVLMDNEGHYKCVAENTVGRAEHIVQLEVEVAPKIADSEIYLQKREGSTVNISCRIQKGNPTPNRRWFFMKKGTRDYVQIRDTTNEVLPLTNVLMDNEGHYKCVAENTVGRAEHLVQLEVEVEPIIADSEIYLKKREGSTVDIGCRIQKGNPTPNRRWFFMKKGTRDYVQMRDTTNEVLRLTNVLMDNEGHYKCEAENTVGRAEHIVQLEVDVAPKIADSETYLKKREGSTVDIGCRIQKGKPTPNIRWFFMKKGTRDYVQMRDKTDDVLHLTNVLMANEGHYKCEAENTVGRAEHIVQLEVDVAPKIADSETYLKKREGSTVDIGCRIQKGKPTPNIRWFFMKKGTRDYVQMRDKTDDVLHLTNVLMANEGHYKCEAENTVGRAEHIVQLEVEVAPKIADSETYIKKREGSTVDIGCRLQNGNPTPNIRWFFMKKETRDYVQMRDTTTEVLHLTNVLMDNEGHYKCVAENTVGRAEHIVQLEVEVSPKIADSETYLKKREGSTVDIGCRIQKGNPRPNIRWFFMKKGTRDYVQTRDTTNEVLRLTNVLMDNEGHYKCEAKNTVGSAEHIVQLEVEVAPKIEDSETYLKYREGSIVYIGCRIQKGNPRPNIRWFFMKKGTRDYEQMRDTTNGVLLLTNVLMDNEGHYKCVAENTVGRAEHIVQLEVEVAPMIDDSETYLKRREGSTVDISCRIQKGNPTPNIKWWLKRNGAIVYKQMWDATTNEVLRLTNVLMDDEGYYMCEAENTVGRAKHIVQLEVEVAPKISDSERYFKKIQGGSLDIHCRILQGKPQPQITWFFKQQGAGAFELLRDKTEQVLHLTNIVMDNAGDYKCVAVNVVNRAEHVVQLEVEVPPRIMFSPPTEPKYKGVDGDVVMKLSCIAEGHPKPIISWTIDNNTIGTDKSNQSYVEDGSLFFKYPISANSNNTYVCVATNAVGEQRQTYEVLISEFEDYNQPEKMYGEVGKPYEINCSQPFTDPNSVRWFYNSVYLNVTGASIHWESASQANDGNYTCRVSDLSGAASVTVELTFGLPPAPSSDVTEFEMEWDDMLQVACAADMNIIGTYEWYRNGVRIKDANESELNVHQFGWGNYTCRASNPLGSLNITYNIPSQDCLIDKNLWMTKKMPVIIDNTPAWPTFSHNQKFVVVPQSEKVHLICQDYPPRGELVQTHSLNNSFTKFPSIRSIEATCDHEDTFLVDGVSQKISELDCILSVTPSVVPSGKQCLGENTQMIDVGFYVDDLIKVYSSCLDTNRNLLLYTTVTMKGSDVPREEREPERPCKQVADCCYETVELVSAEDVGFGAVEWATLKEPRNSVFYCRPSEDTITKPVTRAESWSEATESSPRPSADTTENPSIQRSTTDLPPDPETSWHDIEKQVRNGPRMTVWSGAVNYTQEGNMMVPQYLWKVVKNLDDDMIVAIVHSNTQAPIPKLCADDCHSSSVLALFEPHGFRTYCCSLDEFKTAFKLPLAF